MLKLNNIYKTFDKGSQDEKVVFKDFNLNVKDGDFITIIGSNGAGKSTLFNLICGNFLLDSGTIILNNKDITYLKEYKRSKMIGRIFQDPRLGTCPDLSILENMGLAYLQSKNRAYLSTINNKDKEEIRAILKSLDMGLEDRLSTPVGLLSGGQRQALSLLMATLTKPQLLLLDEHTAALDPKTSDKVLNLTNKIVNDNKITTLMITHNMKEALDYGSRTIMMNEGEIILDIEGDQRNKYSVNDLLVEFKDKLNDRMILS